MVPLLRELKKCYEEKKQIKYKKILVLHLLPVQRLLPW